MELKVELGATLHHACLGGWSSGGSCQALHSEGLSSQRLKLWRMLAGSWLSLMQSKPFPSTSHLLLIHFTEFRAFLLALVYPPGLVETKE